MFCGLDVTSLRRFRCSWWGVPLWLALLLMPLSGSLSAWLSLPDGPVYLMFLPVTLTVTLLMVFDWAAMPGITLALLWRYLLIFSLDHALVTCTIFICSVAICWLGYRIWMGRRWCVGPGALWLGVTRLFWLGFFLPTLLVFLLQITVMLNAVFASVSIFKSNLLTLRTLINYEAILISCVAITPLYYMVIRCFRNPRYFSRQLGLLRQQIAESVTPTEIKVWLSWLLLTLLMVLHNGLRNQAMGDLVLLLLLPTMLWAAARFGYLFTALVWSLVLIVLYQFRTEPEISLHLAIIVTNLLVWSLILYSIGISGVRQRKLIQKSRQAALIDPIIDLHNLHALKMTLAQQASSTLCFLRIPDLDRLSRTWGLDLRIEYKRRLAAHLQPLLESNETIYHLPGFDLALRLNKATHKQRIDQIGAHIDSYSLRWQGLPLQPDIGISYCHVVPPVNHLPALLGELSGMAEVSLRSHQPENLHQGNGGLQRQLKEKLALLNEVQQALDNDQFIMMAQRIEGLRGDDYYELLLRLIDGRGEQVEPGRFLPVVQEFGLMWEIDRWVLDHALGFIDRCRDRLPATRFAVNIRAVNLCRPFFISELERLLKCYQVEPWQLILEISEELGTINSQAGYRTVNRLRQMGCRIAIDNFGARYASYLQLNICRVARLKRMQIVAESVESEAVATALRGLGIDYLQGYAISELQPLTTLGES